MHIPDGYLSPSTCAALYGVAAPFWYTGFRRIKRTLSSRSVPLLALFAAFSFVVMMFNLPLPGGTTGHAVGMGMASIVLGPWISLLAISMALLIQALFFGDGGLTAFGANCFNMAIVGSLVAYGVYRLVSMGAPIASKRRAIGAGLAGYAGINVAALCAAVEFGVQPLWFHDASGAPMYAPYPLSIALPAMMIGHLTFAGLAEFILSAGVVAFLQRADPALLHATAGAVITEGGRGSRKLWIALAAALALTPLGILAVGSAWGEWSPADFSNRHIRAQMSRASRNAAPPVRAPAGMEKLSATWSAPLAGYAPRFVGNPAVGYFISALLGVLLIVGVALAIGWITSRKRRRSFLERTMTGFLRAVHESVAAEEVSRKPGLLQRLDPRVKLAGIAGLIVAVIGVHRLPALLSLFGIAVLIAALSRVSVHTLCSRIWIAVFAFTGIIALPSVFLVPGRVVFRLPVLPWTVTAQGLTSAAFLLLRAETAATLSLLLILCTPWNRLLRAIRFFRAPAVLVLLLEMVHRYIFLLLSVAREMLESRQARSVGRLEPRDQRRLAAATAGVLLDKSLKLSEEVYAAMRARGYRGEVYLVDDPQLQTIDWLELTALLGTASLLTWWGR